MTTPTTTTNPAAAAALQANDAMLGLIYDWIEEAEEFLSSGDDDDDVIVVGHSQRAMSAISNSILGSLIVAGVVLGIAAIGIMAGATPSTTAARGSGTISPAEVAACQEIPSK